MRETYRAFVDYTVAQRQLFQQITHLSISSAVLEGKAVYIFISVEHHYMNEHEKSLFKKHCSISRSHRGKERVGK